MGILSNAKEKLQQQAKQELETLLFDGETIQQIYLVKEDYCAITTSGLIFIDKKLISSKKASTKVPFSKISSVSLKKGGAFSISKEIVIQVGSREMEIDLYDADEALQIFRIVSKRISH